MNAEMLKGVSDKLNGFARYERLATNRKALIAACEGQPNRRCDVGAYYGGASYYLVQKLEIEDVRLVYGNYPRPCQGQESLNLCGYGSH